jgi:hypothetical protein
MSLNDFIPGLVGELTRQGNRSPQNSQTESRPPSRRRGIISVVDTPNGCYTVAPVGADGGGIDVIPNLRPWESGAVFDVGDRVWIEYEGTNPIPFISSGGGGASGGSGGVTRFIRFFS